MDDINPRLPNTDVVVVIGANDVVNPAAREDENSPIYGMPIINVDHARVFVLKRSMGSGFSGVDNPLFFKETPTCSLAMRSSPSPRWWQNLKASARFRDLKAPLCGLFCLFKAGSG